MKNKQTLIPILFAVILVSLFITLNANYHERFASVQKNCMTAPPSFWTGRPLSDCCQTCCTGISM